MQARIGFSTARASVPRTEIGFNFLTYAYIRLRAAKDIPDVLYAVEENLTLGGAANALGSMATDWFTLSHDSVYRCKEILGAGIRNLSGMTGEIQLNDGLYLGFGNGKVDVKFGVVTESGEYVELINKHKRPATGLLTSDVSVSGPIHKRVMRGEPA